MANETTTDTICHICGIRLVDSGSDICSAVHGEAAWGKSQTTRDKPEYTKLPWAMEAWGAIIAALYHLEDAPENDQDRIRRAVEILKECGPPNKGETDAEKS